MATPAIRTAGPGHAVIQHLMMAFVQRKTMEPAQPHDLVSKSEASVALLVAAAAIDANYQSGRLDDFSTETAMRALSLAWERVNPLPENATAGGIPLTDYLRESLASMREVRQQFGL